MSTVTEPHATLAAADVADWVERQGPDSWWTVDGDPWLTSYVSFPCPCDVLVKWLRRRADRRLVVLGDPGEAEPEAVLDALVFNDEVGSRVLAMRWEGAPVTEVWELYEDLDAEARAAERRSRSAGA
jgi:hypothetical protein